MMSTMRGIDALVFFAIWACSVAASFDVVDASPPALSAAVLGYTAAIRMGLLKP